MGPTSGFTGVSFPVPEAANYQKFVQPASRFALVGVFAFQGADRVRVAVISASESGLHRWTAAAEALSAGGDVPAAPAVDGMTTDLHGNGEYRAHLVAVITKRAVAAT